MSVHVWYSGLPRDGHGKPQFLPMVPINCRFVLPRFKDRKPWPDIGQWLAVSGPLADLEIVDGSRDGPQLLLSNIIIDVETMSNISMAVSQSSEVGEKKTINSGTSSPLSLSLVLILLKDEKNNHIATFARRGTHRGGGRRGCGGAGSSRSSAGTKCHHKASSDLTSHVQDSSLSSLDIPADDNGQPETKRREMDTGVLEEEHDDFHQKASGKTTSMTS